MTLPVTPSKATKDIPALDSTPIRASSSLPSGDVLCDILGKKYDLADPETARKVDKILWRLVELKQDDYELTIKDSRN